MSAVTAGGRSALGATYGVLLGLAVLDATGYSLIAPVQPALAEQTGASTTVMGLFVATFPLGMIAGFAAGGFAVRRTSPAALIWAGLALIAAGTSTFVIASDLAALVPGRLVMGLGSGFLWLGIAFATLAAWPGQEYVCMSRIFAAYSVGGLLGPLLGALPGVRAPFAAYLVLIVAAALSTAALRVPSTVRPMADRRVLRTWGFAAACVGIAFAVLALGTLEGVMPLHFGTLLSQPQMGWLYAATSVVVAVAAALAARFRPRRALLSSTVLIVAGFAAVAASQTVWIWLIALAVAGIGIGLANTGSVGVLLDAVPTERIVTAMVLWSQIGILGYLLAPALGGPVADVYGYPAVTWILAVAALVTVIALAISGRGRK